MRHLLIAFLLTATNLGAVAGCIWAAKRFTFSYALVRLVSGFVFVAVMFLSLWMFLRFW
jgi:hypothetical protein